MNQPQFSPHDWVLRAAQANRDEDLASLLRLVAQPIISARDISIRERADLELELLRNAGQGLRRRGCQAGRVAKSSLGRT